MEMGFLSVNSLKDAYHFNVKIEENLCAKHYVKDVPRWLCKKVYSIKTSANQTPHNY
jgi:hypothetical protein